MRALFALLLAAGCTTVTGDGVTAVRIDAPAVPLCAYRLEQPFASAATLVHPEDGADCVAPEPDGADRARVGFAIGDLVLVFHIAPGVQDVRDPRAFHLLALTSAWHCTDWDGAASWDVGDGRWRLEAEVTCVDAPDRSVKLGAWGAASLSGR